MAIMPTELFHFTYFILIRVCNLLYAQQSARLEKGNIPTVDILDSFNTIKNNHRV